ncbi:TetR/AcrR family transcriptional regulator [Massilia sp. erpn]|nr:TetR/AcrR family transcriptional regulator [Massilia sp. erpn]
MAIRSTKRKPSLTAKKMPAQQRGTETYELILKAAAELLADVGIERLSTNMVCERAGLTPPALYRYFPNKYALLCELGKRLMDKQNELIPRWITAEVLAGPVPGIEEALAGLLLETYAVTDEMPGGVWILRALRAVPTVQNVRLDSHAMVAEAQAGLLAEAFPNVPPEELMLAGRVAIDMIYAGVELLFDVPLNPREVAKVSAAMVASYLPRLAARQAQ